MPGDPDGAEEAIYQASAQLPHDWVTRKLVEVSADGRTVHLDPATGAGAVLWTDRPWSSASERIAQSVRFHESTGVLIIGDERRLVRKGSASPPDRVRVAPRTEDALAADKLENVELDGWVSRWLAASWAGEPVAGYARLSEGPLGEVIGSFKLNVPEGLAGAAGQVERPGPGPRTGRPLRHRGLSVDGSPVAGPRRAQALAAPVVDLGPRPRVRGEGHPGARPIRRDLGRPAARRE